MDESALCADILVTESSSALRINENGGIYHLGATFSVVDKHRIGALYKRLQREHGTVSSRFLAKEAKCGRSTAQKIIKELESHDAVLDPSERQLTREKGIGGRSLTLPDKILLLELRAEIPGRSLPDYQQRLLATTGTVVSTTTISDWFLYSNPYRGSIRKANKVPFAKFAAKNIRKFERYEQIVGGIYPWKIKFCDEKSLKGLELIGTSVRVDPLTGHVPPALMPRDFKVRYSIIGICGMDVTVPPMFYYISDGNTSGASFVEFIKCAVSMNYLKKHDVLVLDNAPWHTSQDCNFLDDFLWDCLGPDGEPLNILLVFLPTYSPELSPIEPTWHTMLKKHRGYILWLCHNGLFNMKHATAYAADAALKCLTHEDVAKSYVHMGYM
jgi:transposase